LSRPGRIARTEYSVRQLDPLLLVQLSRIGNNLNQIARRLNELALPAPEALEPLLAEIRRILASVQSP
jgi:DNA polymerase III delta subunit